MPRLEQPDLNGIRDPLCVLTCRELVRTFGLFERIMQPYFAQFGISGAQWGILRHLAMAERNGLPGLRGTDLSERLLIRPPSVSGVVDRLTRAGLVVRHDSAGDQRVKLIRLTDRGRKLVARIQRAHVGQMSAVCAGLSAKQQAQLQRLLARMGRHLQWMLNVETNDYSGQVPMPLLAEHAS
jgi:DNA-binding MarR family transcriptional regulator